MRKAGQSREARQRLLHSAVTVFPTFDQSFSLFLLLLLLLLFTVYLYRPSLCSPPMINLSYCSFFVKNMIQSVLLLLGTMPIHAVFLYNPGPGIKPTAEYNMIQIIIPSLHTMQCIIIIWYNIYLHTQGQRIEPTAEYIGVQFIIQFIIYLSYNLLNI